MTALRMAFSMSAPGRERHFIAAPIADNDGVGMAGWPRQHRHAFQISVCSEISRASSTSIPKYLTVDSSLECPRSN